ncbi:hypothetical protein ABOZ73_07340 [Caulobacter sp. 73W]|uniref:General stress protein 17M-like domain-containing protein n=1 Tax=Caulobacter sp. 73W TaxID=3161137 RepID=A0AB39KX45_9CAUL
MGRTITRLFDSHIEALEAVSRLEAQGIAQSRISLVSNNADKWHEGHVHPETGPGAGGFGDFNNDGRNDTAQGARKGATAGGLVGGGAGLLAGLGLLAIPGLGTVVAAGWLAATGAVAVIGAAAGGAAGGLLGALKEAGHSDDEANVYAEGVRRGGTLVSIKADDDEIAAVEGVLSAGGVDASIRGEDYRKSGWLSFDPYGAPLSPDEIGRERALRDEARSFLGGGICDETAADEGDRRKAAAAIEPLSRNY